MINWAYGVWLVFPEPYPWVWIPARSRFEASPQTVAGTDAQASNTESSPNPTVASPDPEPGR
jgi:hypothetical protein